jgi:exopolyphosphatase/pppGpp-phosphohydrolase
MTISVNATRRPKSEATLPMHTRIGVVEVGSRSVRFMAADFSLDGSFKAIKTDSHLHGVDITAIDEQKVLELLHTLRHYVQVIDQFHCDRVLIYGTALCRELQRQNEVELPSYLRLLTPEEEALASWAAGFMCTQSKRGECRYTVIDQGGGSTEIITATWNDGRIEDILFNSIPIGTLGLARLLEQDGQTYSSSVVNILTPYESIIRAHKSSGGAELYLLGSVATKIAWLSRRRDVAEVYKPYLVNNLSLTTTDILKTRNRIVDLFEEDKDKARSFVDPRASGEDDFRQVVQGSGLLMLISLRLEHFKLRVSGYGTRHGMAFLAMRDLI